MSQDKFTSDIVIGLEIHVELATDTKLFCGCPTHAEGEDVPNSRCCPVCLGHPGSKPVLNKKALDFAMKLCLALDCDIAPELVFSRKSYFYPDMSKNYQITQYELPLGNDGVLKLAEGKEVGITRVHMEEDPASLVHPAGMDKSEFVLVDYNRSGDPLCEVVTGPDLTSPEEARDFMKQLIRVLNYLNIFDVDRCIIKADANISVKESGYERVEVKNITGFKEIERALKYEVQRQQQEVKEGKEIVQATRAWDADTGVTREMRTKETEADYGYILDPDLVAIEITDEMIQQVRDEMPELAADKVSKFVETHKIDKTDAEIIAHDLKLAELFEKVAAEIDPVLAARWMRKELLRVLNYNKKTTSDLLIDEKHIVDLLKLMESKKITDRVAARVVEKMVEESIMPSEYVEKEGLGAVSDTGELEKFCKEAIANSDKAVEDYKSGNEGALNFVVGQVMRMSKGKADAGKVKEMIKKMIG